MSDNKQSPIDTIRLSPMERQRVIDEAQRASKSNAPSEDRRRLRVVFNGHVVVTLKNPDGSKVRYAVSPRNLSTHGLGFIHGQYVHADRQCEVIIPTLRKEWILIPGRIRTCRHLTKLIHDVSVVFDAPINLQEHVHLNAEESRIHHQQVNEIDTFNSSDQDGPMQLSGSVVIGDDSEIDSKLYALWLSKLGLKPTRARNQAKIHDILDNQNIDLLLLDASVDDMSAASIIQQLRLASFHSPIIVLCADESDEYVAQFQAAGANAVLAKPVDRDSLHQVVEQLMLTGMQEQVKGGESRIRSQLKGDAEMRPLIEDFVGELQKLGDLISEARTKQDIKTLETVCLRIKGGGASYGFAPLSRMAKLALGQIQQNSSITATEKALDDLMTTLSRVTAE